MSANTKTGPLCHCLSDDDESQFISYDTSGPTPVPYHTIAVESYGGQHLPLPAATGNVVHIFNKWPTGTAKLWESFPTIKDGDELKVKYYPVSADSQGWSLYYNNENIASGQLPTKL